MKKALSFLLVLLLLSGFVLSVNAIPTDAVTRVSCSMYQSGATGRGFCWFTQTLTGSDLELMKAADFSGDFSGAARYTGTVKQYRERYSHQVAVTDLEPGTAYIYRVGDRDAGLWSAPCSFLTDDRDDCFSFLAIADVQAGGMEDFLHSAQTLRSAMSLLPEAEFTVNLGDYVNDNTNEEWDAYFEAFAFANNVQTGVPVAGNHDGNITNKFNTNCFQNTFCLDRSANRSLEGVYYSFDYGNAHFAVLNSNDMYPMSQAQKNWLTNDMTNSDATWKILLLHRSLYSAGKNINKPDTIIQRNLLLPLIDRLDIDLVLSGHDHMYLRTGQMVQDRRVENTVFEAELFHDAEIRFALDPTGTVYAMPSTAGMKRYSINQNAVDPILDAADTILSTQNLGGCFATVEIESDRLVYRAYTVDDNTGARTQIDVYGIHKTAKQSPVCSTRLDESLFSTVVAWPFNLTASLATMLVSYCRLLLQVVFSALR